MEQKYFKRSHFRVMSGTHTWCNEANGEQDAPDLSNFV